MATPVKSKDKRIWLKKLSMPGVEYRLSHRNMGRGTWTFEVKHDGTKITTEFEVVDPNGTEVDARLREVQFGFLQQGEAKARANREARLKQRDQEFPRAVRAGGEWKPSGAPEEYGVTAGSKDEGTGAPGEGVSGSGSEDTGASEGGETVGVQVSVAEPDPKRKVRGRKPKRKAGSSN